MIWSTTNKKIPAPVKCKRVNVREIVGYGRRNSPYVVKVEPVIPLDIYDYPQILTKGT
jgi:hypothetical protein